ncbi:hypothetical protein MATL_G00042660 [Megalops atlanticus]|uniref:Uncharacterized protein n=1 Tax=Megalops atlanticus TaxID=7932 RepID=A0A9D3TGR9_MEGAT|nr:hypothetical protein MATL_G00042660 [Megalops atlanticus]
MVKILCMREFSVTMLAKAPRSFLLQYWGFSLLSREVLRMTMVTWRARQPTQFAADVNQGFTAVNTRLLSIEERMAALESNCCPSVEETTRKRRAHNPKIAEAVHCLHNSEANYRRYVSEQGLSSLIGSTRLHVTDVCTLDHQIHTTLRRQKDISRRI